MMDLTARQWVRHTISHPIEGFGDMRWKKAGSLKITAVIILLWFAAAIFRDRLYGFQFYTVPDKLFNVVPYIVQTIILFLTWVVGNWAVCTLLDGEGTMRNICIYSGYALIPYIAGIYLQVLLSHILIRDEYVFIQAVAVISTLWTAVLLFSAIRSVHQYSPAKTLLAIALTIAAMLVILFLLVLLLSLFQQMYVFGYSLLTELIYRLKV